jgi:uncharacterized protein YdaU (DUF1376 family)
VADLYYFPLMAGDWLAGEAVSMMTPTQEGAFIHLLCHAWQSKELPCSLPNDDAALAQLSRLGDRWATEGQLVRDQFITAGKGKSRLRNPKLWAVFQEFQAKHQRRVESGSAGGKAKAKGKQSSSNATGKLDQSSSIQNQNQNQSQKDQKPSTARVRELIPEADRQPFDDLLARTPSPDSWVAEMGAMLDGMINHPKATPAQLGRGIRDLIANGKDKHPNIRQLRRYVEGAKEDKPLAFPKDIRARAERLYTELPRHGFTQNRPIDQHLAKAKELAERNVITDLPQFTRELEALLPLTWLGTAREFDREKSIARIAAAIAPIQAAA